jgi:hypothetical protein
VLTINSNEFFAMLPHAPHKVIATIVCYKRQFIDKIFRLHLARARICCLKRRTSPLNRDAVFGISPGMVYDYARQLAVNEHALHSLQDFCRTVYKAWHVHKSRLDMISKARPEMQAEPGEIGEDEEE